MTAQQQPLDSKLKTQLAMTRFFVELLGPDGEFTGKVKTDFGTLTIKSKSSEGGHAVSLTLGLREAIPVIMGGPLTKEERLRHLQCYAGADTTGKLIPIRQIAAHRSFQKRGAVPTRAEYRKKVPLRGMSTAKHNQLVLLTFERTEEGFTVTANRPLDKVRKLRETNYHFDKEGNPIEDGKVLDSSPLDLAFTRTSKVAYEASWEVMGHTFASPQLKFANEGAAHQPKDPVFRDGMEILKLVQSVFQELGGNPKSCKPEHGKEHPHIKPELLRPLLT